MLWLPAAAESLPPARQREILRDALNAFDQAVAAAREDTGRSAELYGQAAAGWLALREAGLCNAALEYNLGNVYFRLGDLGRAILHYLRAQRLSPNDPHLTANLRYARQRVEPQIAPTGRARLAAQLLFWHYSSSTRQRFTALVALSAAGWAGLLAWVWWRKRWLLVVGLVGVAAALVCGSSIQMDLWQQAHRAPAVVVSQIQLRLARGQGADLALKHPLGPGVEVQILQQVGDWVEVRLLNGQTGWLPADAIERV